MKKAIFLAILTVIIIFIALYFVMPNIKLNGPSKEIVNVNKTYTEKGATSKYLLFNTTKNIRIKK